jgi:hypothetical protein
MIEIILSHPLFQLYLVYVVALFIVFLCRGPANCPARTWAGKRRVPEPGIRYRQEKVGSELPFVRELGSSCAAEYTTRYSAAIQRIRQE